MPTQVQEVAKTYQWTEAQLEDGRRIAEFRLGSQATPESVEIGAREMLAKMELTRRELAKDLNIPPHNLIETSQSLFHIDMEMRPISDRTILINDPSQSVALLQEALNDPSTTEQQKNALGNMLASVGEDLADRQNALDRAESELTAAGFTVIRVPGGLEMPPHTPQFNVMNGVIGQTKTGETLYLTNSTSIPYLDEKLRELFLQQGIDRVEFINHRLLQDEGGLDCVTIGKAPPMPSDAALSLQTA